MTAGSLLTSIGQIAVPVQDVERATAFYRDALGLPFLFSVPNLAFFDCGGIRLMLGGAEQGDEERRSSIVYFRVADIQTGHEELRRRGVEFIDEPHLIAEMADHDLWMTFFRDTEGNTLAIMSEVPRR